MSELNNYNQVSEIVGCTRATVRKWWLRNLQEGATDNRYYNCKRPAEITEDEELEIVLKSIEDPFMSASRISKQLDFVNSMPERLNAVLRNDGYPTRF